MKVLNLYSGIGGNRKLWKNCEVTAVENHAGIAAHYKEDYPLDNVIVADAHQYLLDHYKEFDFIWSSPPCQSHSQMAIATRHDNIYPRMELYQEIIFLKHVFKGKWCVENVQAYYEPLIKPQTICRHWFWSNYYISPFPDSRPGDVFYQKQEDIQKSYAENYDLVVRDNFYIGNSHDPIQCLRNCVNPELANHVFKESIGRDLFSND